jgi:type VI secretion system protein ImpF
MPDLAVAERLQPALLDRLTDEHPDERTESRERRVMNMAQLRRAILRDLQWLLNAQAHPPSDAIYDYPLAARSVLNFGLADSAGLSVTGRRRDEVRAGVTRAIEHYEPRMVHHSLRVNAVESDSSAGVKLVFEISGDICPLPMPESLFVRTEVDVEMGQWKLGD